MSIKNFYCVFVRTENNLIAFLGPSNCVNTQYAALSGAMIQSKLVITALVITEYSISDIKLLGTDLSPLNIHLTTPTVTSGNRYTISIENKLIITELLSCVRQFCDQNKVVLHEQVSSSLDKWEALCILMHYEIEPVYTFGIIAFNSFVQYFLLPNDYYVEIW